MIDHHRYHQRARREAAIWQDLNHPHVLAFVGILECEAGFYLVCPYQQNGSLDKYLRARPNVDRAAIVSTT